MVSRKYIFQLEIFKLYTKIRGKIILVAKCARIFSSRYSPLNTLYLFIFLPLSLILFSIDFLLTEENGL